MAGKRSATSDLNHDNWDQDEVAEEAGMFSKASDEVLRSRVFKTAKRRIAKSSEGESLNVFNPVNLAMFGSKPAQSGHQLFGFLSNLQSDVSKTNGIADKSNKQEDGLNLKSTPMISFGNKRKPKEGLNSSIFQTEKGKEQSEKQNSTQEFTFGNVNAKTGSKLNFKLTNSATPLESPASIVSKSEITETNKAKCSKESLNESCTKIEGINRGVEYYYARLKGLNESVAKWINKHVESNPLINLQPIFKDYEIFFEQIEKEYKCESDTNKVTPNSEQKTKESRLSINLPKSNEIGIEKTNTFQFGSTPASTNVPSSQTGPILDNTKEIDTANKDTARSSFKFGSATQNNVSTSDKSPKFSSGISNKESDKNSEVSTSTMFKFGATAPKFNFGITNAMSMENTKESPLSTFKFGSATPAATDKSATNTLTFGNTSSIEHKTDSPLSLFKFGSATTSIEPSTVNTTPKFSFGNANASVSENKTELPPPFKFGSSTTFSGDITTTNTTPKFSFGSTNPLNSGSGFSFGSTTNTAIHVSVPEPTPSNSEENNDEKESEEPPKVEVKQIEEEGHIYMIRCKLFVKKDSNFVEKGVGSLFLKPVPDADKIQVIVRAHNSLGNVLCNFILSKNIPVQRAGKNNVIVVCIPTPEAKPPPVPVLIKVKTRECADQLLEMLEKNKK